MTAQASPPAPTVCANCRKPFGAHFVISRHDADKTFRGSVTVCSALCLIRWSYDYAAHQGARAVVATRDTLTRLLQGLKGG